MWVVAAFNFLPLPDTDCEKVWIVFKKKALKKTGQRRNFFKIYQSNQNTTK